MLSWEAGRNLPGLGSAEMGVYVKGRLASIKTNSASHFLSSGRKSRWGFLFSVEALVPGGGTAPSVRDGTAHTSICVLHSEVGCISDLPSFTSCRKKRPPGWQPPLVFLIATQSIKVISSIKCRSRWELEHWFLLSSSWETSSGFAMWLWGKNLAGDFGASPGSACPTSCCSETP